jgi:hypothetical protein
VPAVLSASGRSASLATALSGTRRVGGGGRWALLSLSLLLSVGAQDLTQSAVTVLLPLATAATLQGMARVMSGQARVYHLSAMLGAGKAVAMTTTLTS